MSHARSMSSRMRTSWGARPRPSMTEQLCRAVIICGLAIGLCAPVTAAPPPHQVRPAASQDTGPGTLASLKGQDDHTVSLQPVAASTLDGRRDTFTGNVSYSADGLGQTGPGGVLRAQMPLGSKILQATLYGSFYGTAQPSAADRTMDFGGSDVQLTLLPRTNSFLDTALADVTEQVRQQPVALDGGLSFTIGNDPRPLDGVALLVVYSHPSLPNASIAVKEGGARQEGDTTEFAFTSPLNTAMKDFSATLSLGIGFGFQGGAAATCGTNAGQFSIVEVNGKRLTSCAGNYDDGYAGNGGLITVGGVGDSLDNPADPRQQAADGRTPRVQDDELYDLVPFVSTGDRALSVFSRNPSFDDNLFLKVVKITGRTVPGFFVREPQESFGHRRSSGYAGDPVNTATGNFVADGNDLPSPAPLRGLEVFRTYNSLDRREGAFGLGWTSQLDVTLDVRDPTAVVQRAEDGRVVTWHRRPDGSYERPEEVAADLRPADAGGWLIAADDGDVWRFDGAGLPLARELADGTSVRIERDQAARVVALVGSTGLRVDLTHDSAGHVTAVTTGDGRVVRYGYTGGRLTSVTDPTNRTTTYDLDAEGRVLRITGPGGAVLAEQTYDAAGRTATQGSPAGTTLSFAYDDEDGTTSVTDVADGASVRYAHDPQGRLISITDPTGEVLTKRYDDAGNLVEVVDRGGSRTTASYDARGNLVAETYADGSSAQQAFDDLGRLISTTSATGGTTRSTYEGAERLPATVTSAGGAVWRYETRDGLVLRSEDPDGVVTESRYDQHRRLVEVVDGLGRTTRFGYDDMGNQVSSVSPSGARSTWEHDAAGRLLKHVDPTGATTTHTYDEAGRPETTTDPAGGVTRTTYDERGRVATTVVPDGGVTRFSYDAQGRLVRTTQPDGSTSSDELGPLSRVLSTEAAGAGRTAFEYDADGQRVAATDAHGGRTTTSYDALGQVVSTTDELGGVTRYAYDAEGRQVSETDPAGNVTTWVYDEDGRVVDVVDRVGAHTRRTWSAAGRLLTQQDGSGRLQRFGYDAAGQEVSRTSPSGAVTRTEYDADGRRVRETSPSGLVTRWDYDPAGRVVAVSEPGRGTTRLSWTPTGLLAREVDATGATRSFTYDAAGNQVSMTAANGATTRSSFDALGRLVARTGPDGTVERFGYDAAGRLTSRTDQLGRTWEQEHDALGRVLSHVDPSGRSEQHVYDAAGRLVRSTASDGATRTFGYDALGRRVLAADAAGERRWTYDAEGRVLSASDTDGRTVTYEYDLDGRRTAMTRPDGKRETWSYDADGQLVELAVGGQRLTYAYDADGRLTEERLPDGRLRRYGYVDGQLASFQQDAGPYAAGATLRRDATGRLISETRAGKVRTFHYDAAGQLVFADGATLTYDERGRRTSLSAGGSTDTYTYDAAGQLLEVARRGRTTTYSYDAAGRRTRSEDSAASTTIEHDAWGRPTALVHAGAGRGGRTLLEHDVTDALVGVTVDEQRTGIVWDAERPVPQPLALETDGSVVDLVHGVSRGFALRDDGLLVFDHDSAGSPLRSSGTGPLVRAQSYDAFGVPQGESASRGLSLGYRGELSVDGLLHLRARTYDATVGAFTSTDPLERPAGAVTATYAYAYADNAPLDLADPLGLSAVRDSELNRQAAARKKYAWSYSFDLRYVERCMGRGCRATPYASDDGYKAMRLLRECFNCYFPISGAPRSYPRNGQVLNLNASPISLVKVSAPVRAYTMAGPALYSFYFLAQPGHFDGAGSEIRFRFYRSVTGRLVLAVRAYVVNDFTPVGNFLNREGAVLKWQAFINNVSKELICREQRHCR
jgi:RHS repeat-associated protein